MNKSVGKLVKTESSTRFHTCHGLLLQRRVEVTNTFTARFVFKHRYVQLAQLALVTLRTNLFCQETHFGRAHLKNPHDNERGNHVHPTFFFCHNRNLTIAVKVKRFFADLLRSIHRPDFGVDWATQESFMV